MTPMRRHRSPHCGSGLDAARSPRRGSGLDAAARRRSAAAVARCGAAHAAVSTPTVEGGPMAWRAGTGHAAVSTPEVEGSSSGPPPVQRFRRLLWRARTAELTTELPKRVFSHARRCMLGCWLCLLACMYAFVNLLTGGRRGQSSASAVSEQNTASAQPITQFAHGQCLSTILLLLSFNFRGGNESAAASVTAKVARAAARSRRACSSASQCACV